MSSNRIYLYDTTLRDGVQTLGVDFSVADKRAIAEELDRLGIDYIEGGWPGANDTDDAFFADPPPLRHARFTAFGMTRRSGRSAANDPGLATLLQARCEAVCLVGKSWDFQVDVALGIPREENLALIRDSVAAVCAHKEEALFDAEHFFDGYKANPAYALACLLAAAEAGARWIVLCDTNGGTLPDELTRIVEAVMAHIPGERLGIHCHNDTETAVASSLAAVRAGVRMVQGTLNGLGERCGNANLITLIPNLILKMGLETGVTPEGLRGLTPISREFEERMNRTPNRHAPYVGESAFAHKGGLHASAVEKNPACYEHIDPEQVGNRRHIVVSNQSGRANLLARFKDLGLEVESTDPRVTGLLELIKQREFAGYTYDGAEASLELLARRHLGSVPHYFEILRFSARDERRYNAMGHLVTESEASIKIRIGKDEIHTVAEGVGPVHALDNALRKALHPTYEALRHIRLSDFRVRILNSGSGSAAMPRVLIETTDPNQDSWRTIGVSTNIIDAALDALSDSFTYTLLRQGIPAPPGT